MRTPLQERAERAARRIIAHGQARGRTKAELIVEMQGVIKGFTQDHA